MPGFYPEEEYDLAGFSVGLVDKKDIIDNGSMAAGDVVIALPSSGVPFQRLLPGAEGL